MVGPYVVEKTFASGSKTAKFVNVFSIGSFCYAVKLPLRRWLVVNARQTPGGAFDIPHDAM